MASHLNELEMKGEKGQILREYTANWERSGLCSGPGLYVRLPILPMLNPRAYAQYRDANASEMRPLGTKLLGGTTSTVGSKSTKQKYQKYPRKYGRQACDLETAQRDVGKQYEYSGQSKPQQQEQYQQSRDTRTIGDGFSQAAEEVYRSMSPHTYVLGSSSSSNRNGSRYGQGDDHMNVLQLPKQPKNFSQITICDTSTDIMPNIRQTLCEIHDARPRRPEKPENLFEYYWPSEEHGHSMEGESANLSHSQNIITQEATLEWVPVNMDSGTAMPPPTATPAWFHDRDRWLREDLPSTLPSCLHSNQMARVAHGLENVHFQRNKLGTEGRDVSENKSLSTLSTRYSYNAIENASNEGSFEEVRIGQIHDTPIQRQPLAYIPGLHSIHPAYNPQRPHSPYLFNPRYQPEVDQYWDRVFGEYAQYQADLFVMSNPHLAQGK